jgi:hypothetical protein
MHYILDEAGNPQPCDDVLVWARWFQTADRHVAQDMDEGKDARPVRISTVFLGLDHSFNLAGPPILWETLVFGGPLDGEMIRYTSREKAWQGHQAMCHRVRQALDQSDA